jgi:CRP-like cAMP-binding protein
VLYQVRYVIADNARDKEADHAVLRSMLTRLRDAGVSVAYPKVETLENPARVRIADRSLDRFYLVNQCRLFRDLPPEACHMIAAALIEHPVARGGSITRAGEPRHSLFLIGEGMVRRALPRAEASRFAERRSVATEFFGSRAAFFGMPQAATATAETPALIYELEADAIGRMLRQSPGLVADFAASLARLAMVAPDDELLPVEPGPGGAEAVAADYAALIRERFRLPLPAIRAA